MSTERDRIIDQLEREFDGEPWHGPSLKDLLKDVTADQAARRPVVGAHSIWELVLHVTGWKREVASRLRGGEAGDPAAGDWPVPGEQTDALWRAAKVDLAAAQAEVVEAVRALPSRRLHQPVRDRRQGPGGARTAYETVYGLIQHDVYHAGQIAVLKRMG